MKQSREKSLNPGNPGRTNEGIAEEISEWVPERIKKKSTRDSE